MRTAQLLVPALLSIFVFGVARAAGTGLSIAANQQLAQAATSGGATPQGSPEAYPLPPRPHWGPTMMGARANRMAKRVEADIARVKAAGKEVTGAQRQKTAGDQALAAGHYGIAIKHYRMAEKSLHAPRLAAPPMPTPIAPK